MASPSITSAREKVRKANDRMMQRRAKFTKVLDWAWGTGEFDSCAPSSAGHAQLRALMKEPPSKQERADVILANWWRSWRRNLINDQLLSSDTGPQPRH